MQFLTWKTSKNLLLCIVRFFKVIPGESLAGQHDLQNGNIGGDVHCGVPKQTIQKIFKRGVDCIQTFTNLLFGRGDILPLYWLTVKMAIGMNQL